MKKTKIFYITIMLLLFTLSAAAYMPPELRASLLTAVSEDAAPAQSEMPFVTDESKTFSASKNSLQGPFLLPNISGEIALPTLPEQSDTSQNTTGFTGELAQSEVANPLAQGESASPAQQQDDSPFVPATFTSFKPNVPESGMQAITPGRTYAGNLKTRGEQQYYIFTVASRGYIELQFTHENISVSSIPCWDVYLYERYLSEGSGGEKSYRELTVMRATRDETAALSPRIGVYPGTYVVMVTNTTAFSTGGYNLKASFVAASNYEAECNDSIYRYNEIYSGRPVKGSSSLLSSGKDTDYFMFEMQNTGYAVVDFSHENLKLPTVGWRITMTDATGRVLYTNRSTLQDTLLTSGAIGLKPGMYFIEIASHEHNGAEYTLGVTMTANGSYEGEPNDSFDTANTLKNGMPTFGSLTLRASPIERDYYSITLPSNGNLQVSFAHDDLLKDYDGWNISVYNSARQLVYTTTSRWNEKTLLLPKIGLPAGTYYIGIDAENRRHNSATYRLIATYELSDGWERESNNTPDTANAILPGSSVHGSLIHKNFDFDVDYFCFEVKETTQVSLRFVHKNLNADCEGWSVSLLDAQLEELTRVVSRWNQTTVSTGNCTLLPGKYYIKVDLDNGMSFSTEEYLLTLLIQ